MNLMLERMRTYAALGARNLMRVAMHRVMLRTRMHPVQRVRACAPLAPFFCAPNPAVPRKGIPATSWTDSAAYFGWRNVPVGVGAPDWHANPISGQRCPDAQLPWWEIGDFSAILGDIKVIWEASRFDWVITFAQAAQAGDASALTKLNAWLGNWCSENRPYVGPNWKCGQEASIRVIHLAAAALVLEQAQAPQASLLALIRLHLERIAPTLSYALAQDNNHGTSEAAALFIGGAWLAQHSDDAAARRWATLGRRWLEERTLRLFAMDGSFSQHSVNYHRLALDTLCAAELWRVRHSLPPFSAAFQDRARAGASWLRAFTDAERGDAPNIGANDGARLLPLAALRYRDFRPTVQLASALFTGAVAYAKAGPWDAAFAWLGLARPTAILPSVDSARFDDGGYAFLRAGLARVYLRYPRFRFRPSQCDALHLDFWIGPDNVLRDAGSYSYHAEPSTMAYFSGTRAHNTAQFDGRDQMPRLGRFLFGAWLKTSKRTQVERQDGATCFGASYTDYVGARHCRDVSLKEGSLSVVDTLSGFRETAVICWRLPPSEWRIEGQAVTNGVLRLEVSSDVHLSRFEMVSGWDSCHYGQRTVVPVLEVEVRRAAQIVTKLIWTV